MKRAAGTCLEPGCAGVPVYRGRCLEHAQWNTGPRQRGRALMRRRAYLIRIRGAHCQRCSSTGPLELHHLDGNPANDELTNLELVCHRCHRRATREQRTTTSPAY